MVAHVVEVNAVVNVWEVEVIILNGHESEASVLPSVRGTWTPRFPAVKVHKNAGVASAGREVGTVGAIDALPRPWCVP